MDSGNSAFPVRFGIGLVDNELEFEVSSKPFGKIFKFMGACKSAFEIVKSILPEFVIIDKYYFTYASFGR